MDRRLQTVVIVGGGTAGWLTAGRIAALHGPKGQDGVRVKLVESPNVPTIGVGEGTWPTMRNTLRSIGITETEFLRQCDASFKQGAKFARWTTGAANDFYYHPLVLPQGFSQCNLAPYWQMRRDQGDESRSFSQAVCFQEEICERGLAPKLITTPEYSAVANYAYHLNAGKFATLLQRHCTQVLGVEHVLDDVVHVNSAQNGDIASVQTREHGAVDGDLFVDCTGFSSILLGKHYDVPFVSRDDVLFIDTALAVQVPYATEDAPIASHTISTATAGGWIWDIGLTTRRGVGHVYSSRHFSQAEAEQALERYLGTSLSAFDVRKIPIRSGHRQCFWRQNCVAVGLSAGFLEPLEASALVLVELSATMLAEQLPATRGVMDIVARRFNDTFSYRWDRIIDFLKLHYLLSQREDSTFWIDNRDPASVPESLQELMTLWRHHSPYNHDFTSNNEVFPAASYQYVLYGMGFRSETSSRVQMLRDGGVADALFRKNREAIERSGSMLPSNRELLTRIRDYGLQPV